MLDHADLVLRIGHRNTVETLAFSADGSMLASGGRDGMIKLWDAVSGAGDGGLVTLWDARTFHRGHRLGQSCFPAAASLAVSPDGRLLAGGETDGAIRLWSVESRCLQSTWTAHAEAVSFVRFLPDGRRMVSASRDGMVVVWDVCDGWPMQTYAAHDGELCSAALSGDGSKIVTRGYGRFFYGASQHYGYSRIRQSNAEVKVWAIDSGEVLWSSNDFPFPSRGALFSPDDSRLFVACDAEIVEQDWICGTKRRVAELDRNAYFIAPGPDDAAIAIGGEGYELPVLDAATGQNRTALWSSADGHRSVVFSPDGRKAAVATCYVDYVDLIDVLSGEIRAQLPGRNAFTALAFAPDGRYLATANEDGTIRLWDPESAKPQLTCTLLPPERESDLWTDWLTYWPEGHRCGSPRAERFIQ
jgi:WD40 repeat protein